MTQRALIVIDVQESFRARPLWRLIDNPDIADDVNRLVDHARAAGDLVVWVLHEEPGTGNAFDPESGHVRYLDGLREPAPGEPAVPQDLAQRVHHHESAAAAHRARRRRAGDLRHPHRAVLRDHRARWPPTWATR